MSKICQEASLKWPQALPLALLRIRIHPSSKEKVSPYEILYRGLYQAVIIPGENHIIGNHNLQEYVISLGKTLSSVYRFIVLASPVTLDVKAHPQGPGDWVYLQTWNDEHLKERWKGPY